MAQAMMQRLGSVTYWLFVGLSSIALFPVALLIWAATVAFDCRLVILHRFTCFWASLYTWFNPAWRVTIEGREKIDRRAAYVMVANHQSLIDIFVLFRLFRHFKWVSKVENFRIPATGWNMTLNRYIKLRRGDRASVEQMMEACLATLRSGSSIMMFPEGSRSMDGVLKAFKPGAFVLALEAGAPILPIVVEGTSNALPKKGLMLEGRHRIRIQVLDPIPFDDFASMPVEQLTEMIRDRVADALRGGSTPIPTNSVRVR